MLNLPSQLNVTFLNTSTITSILQAHMSMLRCYFDFVNVFKDIVTNHWFILTIEKSISNQGYSYMKTQNILYEEGNNVTCLYISFMQ